LKNLGGGGGGGDMECNRAWESVRKNMRPSATENLGHWELKRHKSWFHEECS